MKDRIVLASKGFLMGLADVVPGVSGGTLALILGIYTQFIDALRSVNLSFIKPLWKAIKGGFKKDARADLMATLEDMQIGWLLTLAAGILTAIVIGSRVIPSLLERYPELMFSFFFGLILASVWVPYSMLSRKSAKELISGVLAAVLAFLVVGASVTPPTTWRQFEAADQEEGGQTLKQLAEAGPSALTPEKIYWDDKNAALREAVPSELERGYNPKKKDNPYNELVIPAGTPVQVPTVSSWFMFFAGFIAISAMLLPGISGSFILLTMGAYYFVLNALKGTIKGLVAVDISSHQVVPVALFCLGCLAGLVVFSRVLSWLLHKYPSVTLAALVGVMLGCLRTIWPFKGVDGDGGTINVLPEAFGTAEVYALLAAAGGFALVIGLGIVAQRMSPDKTPTEA